MHYVYSYDTPIGRILLSSNGTALTGLWLEGQKYFAQTMPKVYKEKSLPVFEETVRWLDDYFSGKIPDFMPALAPEGTPFRRMVWDVLLTVPYGETITYGAIANTIAQHRGQERMSAQAVGGAVGHNPISILIPCHRVIGADGSLTGYAGGLDKKRWLLDFEQQHTHSLTIYG